MNLNKGLPMKFTHFFPKKEELIHNLVDITSDYKCQCGAKVLIEAGIVSHNEQFQDRRKRK